MKCPPTFAVIIVDFWIYPQVPSFNFDVDNFQWIERFFLYTEKHVIIHKFILEGIHDAMGKTKVIHNNHSLSTYLVVLGDSSTIHNSSQQLSTTVVNNFWVSFFVENKAGRRFPQRPHYQRFLIIHKGCRNPLMHKLSTSCG
jgi:hypothetical protein